MEQMIKEKIASILKITDQELDSKRSLTSYGIDSLKAIEIQTFIEENWQVECGFENILNDITIADISSLISNSSDKNVLKKPSIASIQSDTYSLSYQQIGMKRFDDSSNDKASYTVGKAIEIHSHISEKILEEALKKLIDIHPPLRASFIKNETKDEQKINPKCQPNFRYLQLSNKNNLNIILNEFSLEPFDLSCAPLFRVLLLEIAPSFYILAVVFHHIIADLWSIGLFFDHLFSLYQSSGDHGIEANSDKSYQDFILLQQNYLNSAKARKDLDFWLDICQRGDQMTNLPFDFPKKNLMSSSGGHLSFSIPLKTSQKLKEFAQRNHVTPFVCLLAAFEFLIHYYSGQKKFYIGTTLPGRPSAKWHSCFGLFANILPIPVQIQSLGNFSSYIHQVKAILSQVFEHSEIPFTYLLEQLSQRKLIQRDMSSSPIFQTMFVYQQVPSIQNEINSLLINGHLEAPFVKKNGLNFRNYPWNIPVSPFELTLYMNEWGDQFQGCFEYKSELSSLPTIDLAKEHYCRLLESLLEEKNISPSCLLAPKHNQEQKCEELDDKNFTIFSLFSSLVKQYPDHILAIDDKNTLTLKAADVFSYKIAGKLANCGIQNGSIVAVLMDHSHEMILVILAIIKLGAILLPLDPHMPDNRIKDILSESQAQLLISDDIKAKSLMHNAWVIDQDSFISEMKHTHFNGIKKNSFADSSIAYMIYTSGSTGKPKGIAVSHRSLISYLTSIIKKYSIQKTSHWTLHSPISFDLTLTSLFLPMIAKHTLHIFSRKIKDTFTLFQMILKNPLITHIKLTPSHLKYLKEIDFQPLSLKQLIVGGEQLSIQLVETIYKHYNKQIEIINEYGPTEATIGTIFGIFSKENPSFHSTMLVDECLDNADFLVCDDQLNALAPNMIGELFLTGDCLAYGYWNRPELTAEFFLPHLWEKGKRMYKTGDLTRLMPNLSLLLLGRIGRQVKIHGFRIEMEEVEQKIQDFFQVKMCTVVLYDKISRKIVENQTPDKDPALCAYLVPNGTLDIDSLNQFLSSQLPYYMKPSQFIVCESIPLTANGKIDFSKLPDPMEKIIGNSHPIILPYTETQKKLLQAWSAVFRTSSDSISIDQHFFNLGADSITTIEIVGKSKPLGLDFTPKNLYDYPTIEQLAKFLDERPQNTKKPHIEISKNYTLSPIQKNFFDNYTIEPNHYNQAAVLKSQTRFNPLIVKKTLEELITHHDLLRSIFIKQDGDVMGHIETLNPLSYHFQIFDSVKFLQEDQESEILDRLQKTIDLEKGPLLAAGLYSYENHDFLLIVIHHLVIDGVSWRIFLEDFDTVYSTILHHQFNKFDLYKTESHQNWMFDLRSYFSSHPEELNFWIPYKNKLTYHRYRIADRQSIQFNFSKKFSDALLSINPLKSQEFQINDLLLAAFSHSLPACTGNSKNMILFESHGRSPFSPTSPDVSRTIGWFTSVFPLLLESEEHDSLEMQIKRVKHAIKQVPNNGIGYQLIFEISNDENRPFLSPSICFNYLGRFDLSHFENFKATPILNNISSKKEQTPFNLEFILYYSDDHFHLTILYNTYSYSEEAMSRLYRHFHSYLENLCLTPIGEVGSVAGDFGDCYLSMSEFGNILASLHLEQKIESIIALSPMQRGILFEEIRFPGKYYIEQAILEFAGNFNEKLWINAFTQLITQFEILRTIYIHEALDRPRQVILKSLPLEFSCHNIATLSKENQNKYIEECITKDKKKPFSLSKGPLMRLTFIECHESYQIIWSFHHIILDGWSLTLLFKQLIDNLEALHSFKELKENNLFSVKSYYTILDNKNKQKAIDYYKALLSDYDQQVKLPKKLGRENRFDKSLNEVSLVLPNLLIEKLQNQAQIHFVTLNTLFQATWGILVGSYSNCSDVVFGMVSSGRTLSLDNIENMVGLFIATLPVRVTFTHDMLFIQLCQNIQKQTFQTQQHLHLSLSEIQSLSTLKQNLLDHLFIFENYPLSGKALEIANSKNLPFKLKKASLQETVPYNLTVTVLPGDHYTIQIKYHPELYSHETLQNLISNWQFLLHQIANDSSKSISELSCISGEDYKTILSFNNNEINTPPSCIHKLFEKQLELSPDSVAIVYDHHYISYRELNRRASLLSLFLQKQGYGTEDLIGILMERSIDLVICWLAVLKAGCAYVPLNVNEPVDRLKDIISETHIPLILTHEKHQIPDITKKLAIDKEWVRIASVKDIFSDKGTKSFISPQNLAYVIYTSGSTGKPKGIAMEHASVINHICWLSRTLSISKNDRLLQCTDFSFDITICSFYGLFVGGSVVLVPQDDSKNMLKIVQHLKRHLISMVQLGSSLFSAMMQEEVFSSSYHLRYILCGGSPLKKDSVQNWYHSFQPPLMNLYGPTETCIDATFHQVSLNDLPSVSIPIGKPIDNDQAFLLNDSLDPCPLFAEGELFIGGAGVARGYYARPDLTAQAFLPHLTIFGKRLYKTGDICSWNHQQELILHGRSDHQVKIRGLRVELKEIENVITCIEGIKEAFVCLTDQGMNPRIIAYVIPNGMIDQEILRTKLLNKLPTHMIPSFTFFLDRFPLNERQKIDVSKLPVPSQKREVFESNLKLSSIEKDLQALWADLLNLEPHTISIDDNFFDLGGNSLTLMQLQNKIFKTFSRPVSLDSFFQYPSIRTFASYLCKKEGNSIDLQQTLEKREKQNQYRSSRKRLQKP